MFTLLVIVCTLVISANQWALYQALLRIEKKVDEREQGSLCVPRIVRQVRH